MSGVDPAPRPRPQYGEYATPEEVAAITGRTPDAAAPLAVHPGTSVPVDPPRDRIPAPAAPDTPASAASRPAPDAAGRVAGRPVPRFRYDRPIAWGLLVAGAVGFLLTMGTYLNFAAAMRQSAESMKPWGYGEFDAAGLANDLGPWVGMTHLLLLVITILLTVAASRRWRTIFWIPIVGAVVWGIAQSVFTLVILVNDPGYRELLSTLTGG